MNAPAVRIEPFGDAGVRLTIPEALDPGAVFAALRHLPGVTDVVVFETRVLVALEAGAAVPDVAAALAGVGAQGAAARNVVIRAVYDGPDLARVAELAGMTPDEVVAAHADRDYAVRAVGFVPGFAYLGPVDPRIAAPRLPSPRARVEPGAIGIAGARTGVYPSASPGGWNLMGRVVDFVAFDPKKGAALRVGDRVRFARVG